jgi:hypothetical protein
MSAARLVSRTLLGSTAPSEGSQYDAGPAYAVVDDDFNTTETYRVTLIFLSFVVLSLLVEKGLHSLEFSLSASGRKGLVGALHHLQSEVRRAKCHGHRYCCGAPLLAGLRREFDT